jgi:hypothetical protein
MELGFRAHQHLMKFADLGYEKLDEKLAESPLLERDHQMEPHIGWLYAIRELR